MACDGYLRYVSLFPFADSTSFFCSPGALLREESSVQSTQLNATGDNSINAPNIYTVQRPRGRDGRDGLPGRDGQDGVQGRQGEKGDTGLQGPPGPQGT